MKSTMNEHTSKHSLAAQAAPEELHEARVETDADPILIRAEVELVRIHEEQRTLRTWAICGTIVAGMAIISHAAVQRHRQIFESGNP